MAVKAQNLSHETTRELLAVITLAFYSGGRVSCPSCPGQGLERRGSRTQEAWGTEPGGCETQVEPGAEREDLKLQKLPQAIYQVCG